MKDWPPWSDQVTISKTKLRFTKDKTGIYLLYNQGWSSLVLSLPTGIIIAINSLDWALNMLNTNQRKGIPWHNQYLTCETPGTPSMNAVPVHQTFISGTNDPHLEPDLTVLCHAVPMLEGPTSHVYIGILRILK